MLAAAVATAVLALLAVVTAIFAIKAFGKQSAELAILTEQAADQRATNVKLAAAELQALELRESLAHRKAQQQQARRGQASRVFISQEVDVSPGARTTAFMEAMAAGESPLPVIATVHNTSSQPIYDVELLWHRGTPAHGDPNPEPVPPVMPGPSSSRRARSLMTSASANAHACTALAYDGSRNHSGQSSRASCSAARASASGPIKRFENAPCLSPARLPGSKGAR